MDEDGRARSVSRDSSMESDREVPAGSPSPASCARPLIHIESVQLRVVGEDLSILQEFEKRLELEINTADQRCRVCFLDGE